MQLPRCAKSFVKFTFLVALLCLVNETKNLKLQSDNLVSSRYLFAGYCIKIARRIFILTSSENGRVRISYFLIATPLILPLPYPINSPSPLPPYSASGFKLILGVIVKRKLNLYFFCLSFWVFNKKVDTPKKTELDSNLTNINNPEAATKKIGVAYPITTEKVWLWILVDRNLLINAR